MKTFLGLTGKTGNNMDVKWYIEKDFFWEGQPDTILSVLKSHNIPYTLQKERFSSNYPYESNDCVIVYGSIEFVRKTHRETAWIPGASWVETKNLLCSTYYAYYGKYLLNQECFFIPLSTLYARKDFVFNKLSEDNKIFIRPDSPYKEFTGFVVSKDDFEKRIVTMSYGNLEPDLMVLAARTQEIKAEYRFVVSKNGVIAGSRYKLNGEHDEDPTYPIGAYDLALEISKEEWMPAPIFVVDIGEISNDEFRLLEINSFNCSGMYLCDLSAIVIEANKIALKEWEDNNL